VVDRLAAGFREEEWATLVQRSRLHRSTIECRLQWNNSVSPSVRCVLDGSQPAVGVLRKMDWGCAPAVSFFLFIPCQ
jgi:hypothetical protein